MSLDDLKAWLDRLPWRNISLGSRELSFSTAESLEKDQLGYRFDTGYNSLISDNGGWREDWFVFAFDELGDPYFTDLNNGSIHTAMHGEGTWEPEHIATGLDRLQIILEVLHTLSNGRGDIDALNTKPLLNVEVEHFLRVAIADNNTAHAWNWRLWVEQE